MRNYLLFIALFVSACSEAAYVTERATGNGVADLKLKVSDDTVDTGIDIQWVKPNWEFVDVRLYRGERPTELFLYKQDISQTSFVDHDTLVNVDYFYQIQAYNTSGQLIGSSHIEKGKRAYRSADQAKAPTLVTATDQLFAQKVELMWVGQVSDQFRVYRSKRETGPYFPVAEVYFTPNDIMRYVDVVNPASTYWYKVATIAKDGNNLIEKEMAQVPVKGATFAAPSRPEVTKGDMKNLGKISIEWTPDKTADFYKIYRANSETGKLELIVPYIETEKYLDGTLPNIKGEIINGRFVFPFYYYAVSTVKGGVESRPSDREFGFAVDPAVIKKVDGFEVEIDQSSYPYKMSLVWEDGRSNNGDNVYYRLVAIAGANNIVLKDRFVGADTQQFTKDGVVWNRFPIKTQGYNSSVEYILTPFNRDAGEVAGIESAAFYTMLIPSPPKIVDITKKAYIEHTNVIEDVIPFHSRNSDKSYSTSVDAVYGSQVYGWSTTMEAGYITLSLERYFTEETGTKFHIYRATNPNGPYNLLTVFDPDAPELDEDGNIVEKPPVAGGVYHYTDREFTRKGLKGSINTATGQYEYPKYYYKVTLVNGDNASAATGGANTYGCALDPADILPATASLTVPGHYSNLFGLGTWVWRTHPDAPHSYKIDGKGGVNHLYLAWDDVANAVGFDIGYQNTTDPVPGAYHMKRYASDSNKETIQWFNTEIAELGLYQFPDLWAYQADAVSFEVQTVKLLGSYNGTSFYQKGGKRGLVYKEPNESPY